MARPFVSSEPCRLTSHICSPPLFVPLLWLNTPSSWGLTCSDFLLSQWFASPSRERDHNLTHNLWVVVRMAEAEKKRKEDQEQKVGIASARAA
jgi:hypothetical protein